MGFFRLHILLLRINYILPTVLLVEEIRHPESYSKLFPAVEHQSSITTDNLIV